MQIDRGFAETLGTREPHERMYIFFSFPLLRTKVISELFHLLLGRPRSSFLRSVHIAETRLATCFHTGFLHCLFLDPEDGGDMFLRNVG
jgi:hypothetical protein